MSDSFGNQYKSYQKNLWFCFWALFLNSQIKYQTSSTCNAFLFSKLWCTRVSLYFYTVESFSEKVSIVIFLTMAQHSSDIRVYNQNREERKDSTLYHNMSGRLVNLIQNYKHLSRFEILGSPEEYFSSFVLCTGVKF